MATFPNQLSFENPNMNYADQNSAENWASCELGWHGDDLSMQAAREYAEARNTYMKSPTPENGESLTEKTRILMKEYEKKKDNDPYGRYNFMMQGLNSDKKLLQGMTEELQGENKTVSPLTVLLTIARKMKNLTSSFYQNKYPEGSLHWG